MCTGDSAGAELILGRLCGSCIPHEIDYAMHTIIAGHVMHFGTKQPIPAFNDAVTWLG